MSLGGESFQKECDDLLKKELIDIQLKSLPDRLISELLEENMNAAIEQILRIEKRMVLDDLESKFFFLRKCCELVHNICNVI